MILFFDDYLGNPENQIFLHRLRKAVRVMPIEVVEEKVVHKLEHKLRSTAFRVAIFDVMAEMPDAPELSALAGIEILRRCRVGDYGQLNRDIPIFMRSARFELHVQQMAREYGCTRYFQVGTDDALLINAIVETLKLE
jgi:CheY-like chemotaxis protein